MIRGTACEFVRWFFHGHALFTRLSRRLIIFSLQTEVYNTCCIVALRAGSHVGLNYRRLSPCLWLVFKDDLLRLVIRCEGTKGEYRWVYFESLVSVVTAHVSEALNTRVVSEKQEQSMKRRSISPVFDHGRVRQARPKPSHSWYRRNVQLSLEECLFESFVLRRIRD